MASILIVHQNFPGQFPHIADALCARGDRVAAIGGPTATGRPGIDLRRWSNRRGTTPGIFAPATRAEADLIRAEAAMAAAMALDKDGFRPDVIVGHPGWGETLMLKELWPAARIILLGELFYRGEGGDTGFDPEFGLPDLPQKMRTHAKNASQSLAYVMADRIVCPTPFQAASFPPALRPLIRVIHEGVDLDKARRRPGARFALPGGRVLDGSRPIFTFVSRTLEPLRGFHIVLRALPALLDACPDAEVVMIGGDAPGGYGAQSPDEKGWRSWMLAELGERLDRSRVHFVGKVPHAQLIDAFTVSWAHVYYTYPFVLSWSLVEAMACECLVIASDTPPVRDAITDGENGILLPFFDVAALSDTLIRAVREPGAFGVLRRNARSAATMRFGRDAGTAAWLATIDQIAAS